MRILLAIVVTLAAAASSAQAESVAGKRDGLVAQATPSVTTSPATTSPATTSPPADSPEATAKPVVKPSSPPHARITAARSENADCTWTGKRTIQVLVRDDIIAADGFFKFYNAFGCPVRHLSEAFSCTVDGLGESDAHAVETRIEACWNDPSAQPEPPGKAQVDDSKPVPRGATAPPKPETGTAYPKQ